MRRVIPFCALVVAALVACPPSVGASLPPLETGVVDPNVAAGDQAALGFARIRAAGATIVRLTVDWSAVATAEPADAADPADPAYDWTETDREVRAAVAADLTPLVTIGGAPSWAQSGTGNSNGGPVRPDAQAFGLFAKAAAVRYSGSYRDLPRIRYWQVFNEPNLLAYLQPQLVGGRPVSPLVYRDLVNAFAGAVHGVRRDDVVVAGGLAPYGIERKGQPLNGVQSVAPLTFMRHLLCMSGGAHPRPTCKTSVAFDAFSVHPYTWGGPTHSAYSPDDVALGDLLKVHALLDAAYAAGHIRTSRGGRPRFWVTEFSYDTRPPDPKAVPVALQARWTAEALYRMWQSGVTLVCWWLLRDEPYPADAFQSGLYYAGATVAGDRPKPTLTAFRFPFVAELRGAGYDLWGRTPTSRSGLVTIEEKRVGGWQRIGVVRADAQGMFFTRWSTSTRTGFVRARFGDSSTLAFQLRPVPDRAVAPFG